MYVYIYLLRMVFFHSYVSLPGCILLFHSYVILYIPLVKLTYLLKMAIEIVDSIVDLPSYKIVGLSIVL